MLKFADLLCNNLNLQLKVPQKINKYYTIFNVLRSATSLYY